MAIPAAVASFITKTVLHPIDTLKCRMQMDPQTTWSGYISRWKGRWSVKLLFAGLAPKLVLTVPAQSLYMSTYEHTKTTVAYQYNAYMWRRYSSSSVDGTAAGASAHDSVGTIEQMQPTSWTCVFTATFVAGIVTSVLRLPMEALKMRQQAMVYHGTLDGIRHIVCGIGLWRTFVTLLGPQTFLNDIPYALVQWVLYETLKPWLLTKLGQWKWQSGETHSVAVAGEEERPHKVSTLRRAVITFLAGSITGVVASLITNPLDVIKTRVVVLRQSDPHATIWREARWIWEHKGVVNGFFASGSIRVLWIGSNLAVYMTLFELFKLLGASYAPPAAAA